MRNRSGKKIGQPEFVAAAMRVFGAIRCMKPVKTTARSAVSSTTGTKPGTPL